MLNNNTTFTLKHRILVFIVLGILVYIAPWWLSIFGACTASLFFDSYFELMLIIVAVDTLYAGTTGSFFGVHYFLSLISVPIFIVLATLRRRIRV